MFGQDWILESLISRVYPQQPTVQFIFMFYVVQAYSSFGNRRIAPTQNCTHEIKNVFMMLILGQVRLSKGQEGQGPTGLESPAGARIKYFNLSVQFCVGAIPMEPQAVFLPVMLCNQFLLLVGTTLLINLVFLLVFKTNYVLVCVSRIMLPTQVFR